jgi:hypothetical protein
MDWTERLAALGGVTGAAGELLKAWPRVAPKHTKPLKPSAIANRIRELRRGANVTWWQHHEWLLNAFAEALGVGADELLGRPNLPSGTLEFAEFPGLPPLRPDELPCRYLRAGDLLDQAISEKPHAARRPRWIVAPPGAGKSLVVRFLRSRYASDYCADTVRTLDQVGELATSGLRLVLEVEEPSAGDVEALRQFVSRPAPTVVLAAFNLPGAPPQSPLGERMACGWLVEEAKLPQTWRAELLEWIDARLERGTGESKLRKADIVQWLERHDPSSELIATPGDLLALCADFHLNGPDDASLARRAKRWLETAGVASIPEDAPRTWAKQVAVKVHESLIAGHLHDTSARLGALLTEGWAKHVPAELALGSMEGRPGAKVEVAYLQAAGLLRATGNGWTPFPRWVFTGVLQAAAEKGLREGPLESWGRLAADESRQQVVDDALDALPAADLAVVVRDVIAAGKPKTLAGIGALEATFSAVGRRLGSSPAMSDVELRGVQRLTMLQLDQLQPDLASKKFHHPFTRRDLDGWLADAWTVSLRAPKPSRFQRPNLAWELPGWARELRLADLPQQNFPSSTVGPNKASASVQRLARLSMEVVARLRDHDVPAEIPRLLVPALLLSNPRTWRLTPSHLDLLHDSWDEEFLAAELSIRDEPLRAYLALKVWRLVAEHVAEKERTEQVPVSVRLATLQNRHSPLVDLVLANLPVSEIERTVRDHGVGTKHGTDGLLLLPKQLKRGVLEAWLALPGDPNFKYVEALELVPLLGIDDGDLALDLVRHAGATVAAPFVRFVWSTAPARALAEAQGAIEGDLPVAEAWFEAAPRDQLPRMLEVVDNGRKPPAWLGRWAYRHVLDGGDAAETLYLRCQT